ncbi:MULTISPECIES: ACP S-malonyltransferase [Gammaproteobacteria]|uniref:ACP S-malonyltransferase n=1 Tax=Gammaproteobacteria TaxID=1236 RepID=UPI000DCFA1A3|nr:MULTISPECIES: ACP S-malonyltransferase [Gammaproteobacteria]RTE87282.1 [acyl-carrier-protein] S-malonyltransferase [Aliidiomarina sp. B3213]TCZ92931.1 [acyl-carrier-protein] S-malonyltransferase [Lysobacter sp. N42]
MAKTAFIFPGQGSQAKGMLADLVAETPVVGQTFAEASEALGYDLWSIIEHNEDDQLNQTAITQPAILAASVAVYRALGEPKVDFMAGHSLGEYSALVCSGALAFQDAIRLVSLRGKAMQEAVPAGVGAMAAVIGLDDESVIRACEASEQGEVVSAVNFNSPGQVVIAGNKAAVERAGEKCKEAGAKRVLPLPVSVPSHCALMQSAAKELEAALTSVNIELPTIPVVHNVDVTVAESVDDIKTKLVQQLYSPVQWTKTVEWLVSQGVEEFHEVGPGKVLSGLVKRIHKPAQVGAIHNIESVQTFSE